MRDPHRPNCAAVPLYNNAGTGGLTSPLLFTRAPPPFASTRQIADSAPTSAAQPTRRKFVLRLWPPVAILIRHRSPRGVPSRPTTTRKSVGARRRFPLQDGCTLQTRVRPLPAARYGSLFPARRKTNLLKTNNTGKRRQELPSVVHMEHDCRTRADKASGGRAPFRIVETSSSSPCTSSWKA